MDFSEMVFTWVDAAVFAVVFFCMILGFISGFVMQLASLFSVMAGVALAIFAGPLAAESLGRWIDSAMICGFLGHSASFCAGSLIVRLFCACLSVLLAKMKLQRFDRLAGGLMGAGKGVVIAAVLIVISAKFPAAGIKQPLEASVSGNTAISLIDRVSQWAEENELPEKINVVKEKLLGRASSLGTQGTELARAYHEKYSTAQEDKKETPPDDPARKKPSSWLDQPHSEYENVSGSEE